MVFKRFTALGSALLLALASLFTLAFTSQAQAVGSTLYWCEFSSNSNWSIATNWNTSSNCSSGTQRVPQNGDSLVFDNSALTSNLNLNNNIAGLDLNSITLQGTSSGVYILNGDDISLDSGITDTVSQNLNDRVNMNLTLTANQSFDNSGAGDILNINGTVDLGSNNLTLVTYSSGVLEINNSMTGAGTLTISSPPSGPGYGLYQFDESSPGFSGPVVIDSNTLAEDLGGTLNAFGSGGITVNNGGSLYLNTSNTTGTYPNDLNLAGDGIPGQGFYAITSCLNSCSDGIDTTLTLTGQVTLSGDTVLVNGVYTVGEPSPPTNTATFDFTGNGIYNGFTLTGLANSSTIVDPPTPVPSSTGSGSSGPSSSSSSVKAPNTGEALASNHSYTTIIGAVFVAGAILLISSTRHKRLSKDK